MFIVYYIFEMFKLWYSNFYNQLAKISNNNNNNNHANTTSGGSSSDQSSSPTSSSFPVGIRSMSFGCAWIDKAGVAAERLSESCWAGRPSEEPYGLSSSAHATVRDLEKELTGWIAFNKRLRLLVSSDCNVPIWEWMRSWRKWTCPASKDT